MTKPQLEDAPKVARVIVFILVLLASLIGLLLAVILSAQLVRGVATPASSIVAGLIIVFCLIVVVAGSVALWMRTDRNPAAAFLAWLMSLISHA